MEDKTARLEKLDQEFIKLQEDMEIRRKDQYHETGYYYGLKPGKGVKEQFSRVIENEMLPDFNSFELTYDGHEDYLCFIRENPEDSFDAEDKIGYYVGDEYPGGGRYFYVVEDADGDFHENYYSTLTAAANAYQKFVKNGRRLA